MKEKLSDYTKKELMEILGGMANSSQYTTWVEYQKEVVIKDFEELWDYCTKVNNPRLKQNGWSVYGIKVGRTWIHKHRYVKLWDSVCGDPIKVTKENFDNLNCELTCTKIQSKTLTGTER